MGWGHLEVERALAVFKLMTSLDLRGLLDWQVGALFALENLRNIETSQAKGSWWDHVGRAAYSVPRDQNAG